MSNVRDAPLRRRGDSRARCSSPRRGRWRGSARAAGDDRRGQAEVRRVPDDDVLGAGRLQRVDDRADVGRERLRCRQHRAQDAGTAGDRAERRARVVAAAGDDVEPVRRGDAAGGAEVERRLRQQAVRKAARPRAGAPVVAPPKAKSVPPASDGVSGRPSMAAKSLAHTGAVAVRAERVGVGGNVGVAGDRPGTGRTGRRRRCCRCRRGCRRRRRARRTGRRWPTRPLTRRRQGRRPAAAGEVKRASWEPREKVEGDRTKLSRPPRACQRVRTPWRTRPPRRCISAAPGDAGAASPLEFPTLRRGRFE